MVIICKDSYPAAGSSKYGEYFEQYPYPLSDFQKYAIEAIIEGHHTLITAHTGSGKTLPAEFAITHFTGLGKKVIYTSPIKALSNQKYYEFSQKYPHIRFGLMTGDIKTNPEADVIIMTTEILMNALSRTTNKEASLDFKIDIETELGCVVFDEIHYINDAERGQVWEKTILMLPQHIQMVMLSATIDAPERFAKWCESTKPNSQKQVYLASTNHRVVPLSHYGYITTTESMIKNLKDKVAEKEVRDSTNKLILLQNEHGVFQESGHKEIVKMQKLFDAKQVFMKRKYVLNNLALFLRDREMLPAIAFVFSRKNVEACAHELTIPLLEDDSKVGYIVRRECEQIVRKLPNFQEYLNLPEYQDLVGLLEKGIGIHHSGMIPILREIVELMISKKYIKILFATESFAIGLDCPIKTAVMTGISKFDGRCERPLYSHEYTQMAGRAGRRGIDTVGHVVHCDNLFAVPALPDYKAMLGGKPQTLVSKFRISYSIILNLLNNGTADFAGFVEKAMIFGEIQDNIIVQKEVVEATKQILAKKADSLKLAKTPADICIKYIDLESKVKSAVNKKRKEIEREMQSIQDENKSWLNDVKWMKEYQQCEKILRTEEDALEYLHRFIGDQIQCVLNVLIDNGFITAEPYTLLPKGIWASKMAEIHPLIMAETLIATDCFSEFTTKQIIGFLSTLADIKVPEELRFGIPHTEDAKVKSRITDFAKLYQEYESKELDADMRTGIHYDDALKYDIIDIAMAWTECMNEEECKWFIQTRLAEKEITTGDFAKAMMKLSAISRELSGLAEEIGNIEFLKKLSEIDGLILKYIATTQSLYV